MDAYKKSGADYMIAIDGGSSMDTGFGMVELEPDGVVGGDDEDEESPPGR